MDFLGELKCTVVLRLWSDMFGNQSADMQETFGRTVSLQEL